MQNVIAAALLGFLNGFIGLPLIFYLIKPLVSQILKAWGGNLIFTKYLASFAAFFFLLLIEFGVADIWLNLLTEHNSDINRDYLGKIWRLWIFIGLISYIIIPNIESRIRKKNK